MRSKFVIMILILFFDRSIVNAQWLDPQSVQATVLIEKLTDKGFITHGTGFLLYNYNDPSKFIVITCAHIIGNNKQLCIRVNADSSLINYLKIKNIPALVSQEKKWLVSNDNVRFIVDLYKDTTKLFAKHPTLDIGAFYLTVQSLQSKEDTVKKEYKFSDKLAIPNSMLSFRKDLRLGDEVYFIGFPFGIGTVNLVEPLIRSGSVAWFSKYSNEFLLDAFSFGGNSGSPIFKKKILGSKPGDLSWGSSKLIGIIIGHQGLKLENILTQPNPNELKFQKDSLELNFGLARCLYVDDILDVVKLLNK